MITFKCGDLMEAPRHAKGPWTVVTTNGFVKNNGRAVMGRGIARQARDLYPDVDLILGRAIEGGGNVPHYLQDGLVSMPVKHNWWEQADPALIKKSTVLLGEHSLYHDIELVRYPRPGSGNGGLEWDDVREWWLPLLEQTHANVEVWNWTQTREDER